MDAWLQVSVAVPAGHAESGSRLLEGLGAVAVTFVSAGTEEIFEPFPGEQPLWETVRIEALFGTDVDLRRVRLELQGAGARVLDVNIVADADWREQWRVHAVRQLFGGRLWVLPRDEPVPDTRDAAPSAAVLRLEPGLAFGSGSHPTTRLCLERLAAMELSELRVLDFGCGSGILALAACLLGAREVVAIDHDPQAIAATLDNAAFNGIGSGRLRVGDPAQLDMERWGDPPFDVVVANILANPLVELAPRLTALVRPGGALILSGLLADQEPLIRAAYGGVRFGPAVADQEWIRLDGQVG